jgi:hypothetical protein
MDADFQKTFVVGMRGRREPRASVVNREARNLPQPYRDMHNKFVA